MKKLESWSESTPYDELLAHYGYLLREQVKLINAGDFEALAKEFYGILLIPGFESEIFKINKYIDGKAAVDTDYLMNRMDFNYPARNLTDTYVRVLFPSLEVLANIERVRDPSYTFTKKSYYSELDYLIQLAKRADNGSELKKLYSMFASIHYNLAGWESLFIDENVEESDPEFIKAKKELTDLGEQPGTLAELLEKRKQLLEKQRAADREYWTSRIPKDVIKDSALSAEVLKLAKAEWGNKGIPIKAILQHREWQHKSNAFGKVTSRQKFVTVIMRMNDNTYRMLECSVIQDNDGVRYGASRLHEMFTKGGNEINWTE
ncbi:MAG: hypothetical protein ACRC3Z_12530 [Phocaeicola sp.]